MWKENFKRKMLPMLLRVPNRKKDLRKLIYDQGCILMLFECIVSYISLNKMGVVLEEYPKLWLGTNIFPSFNATISCIDIDFNFYNTLNVHVMDKIACVLKSKYIGRTIPRV